MLPWSSSVLHELPELRRAGNSLQRTVYGLRRCDAHRKAEHVWTRALDAAAAKAAGIGSNIRVRGTAASPDAPTGRWTVARRADRRRTPLLGWRSLPALDPGRDPSGMPTEPAPPTTGHPVLCLQASHSAPATTSSACSASAAWAPSTRRGTPSSAWSSR